MKKKDLPLMQHYLPQSYLRGFTDHGHRDKKGKLRVIDLVGRKCFSCSPKDVAKIRDYYVFVNTEGKVDYSMETEVLQHLDGEAIKVIREIERTRVVPSGYAWETLCAFIAFLQLRTPHFRQWNQELAQHFFDFQMHFTLANPEAYEALKQEFEEATGEKLKPDYAEMKAAIESGKLFVNVPRTTDIKAILDLAPQTAALIQNMTPHLLIATEEGRFVTGDSPIYLLDTDEERRRANLVGVGWATPEVEVTVPLTSRCCLGLTWRDPSARLPADDFAVANCNLQRALTARQYLFAPQGNVPLLDRELKVVWGEEKFLDWFSELKQNQPAAEIMGGPIPRRPPRKVRR